MPEGLNDISALALSYHILVETSPPNWQLMHKLINISKKPIRLNYSLAFIVRTGRNSSAIHLGFVLKGRK